MGLEDEEVRYDGKLSSDGRVISGTVVRNRGGEDEPTSCEFKMMRTDRALPSSAGGAKSSCKEPLLKRVLKSSTGVRNVVADYQDMLDEMGLGQLLDDPEQFRKLLETVKQLKTILDRYGFGELMKDPAGLADILDRYNGLKKAFEEYGFDELFEDPYNLKGFLRNYTGVREAFRACGLEYLMDSSPAMRDFLAKFTSEGAELKDVRDKAAHLDSIEKLLMLREDELRKVREEANAFRAELEKYQKLGSLTEVERWKQEAADLKIYRKAKSNLEKQLKELEDRLLAQEQQNSDAMEQWKAMFDRYKELDIFKLDVIARELKVVLQKVARIETGTKSLRDDAGRLKDFSQKQHFTDHGTSLQDQCKQSEAHIHETIMKCLNEKQRMISP